MCFALRTDRSWGPQPKHVSSPALKKLTAHFIDDQFLRAESSKLQEPRQLIHEDVRLGQCSAPTIYEDLARGIVKLACHNPSDAQFYWTDDGSDPRTSKSRRAYRRDHDPEDPWLDSTRPVINTRVAKQYVIKAVALGEHWNDSSVTTKTFVVRQCQQPVIKGPAGKQSAAGNKAMIYEANPAAWKTTVVWLADDGFDSKWNVFDASTSNIVNLEVLGTTEIKAKVVVTPSPAQREALHVVTVTTDHKENKALRQKAELFLGQIQEHWLESNTVTETFHVRQSAQPSLAYNEATGHIDVINPEKDMVVEYQLWRRSAPEDTEGTRGGIVFSGPQQSIPISSGDQRHAGQAVDDDVTVRAWGKRPEWCAKPSPSTTLRVTTTTETLEPPGISIKGLSDGSFMRSSMVIVFDCSGPLVYTVQEFRQGATAPDYSAEWREAVGNSSVPFVAGPHTDRIEVQAQRLAKHASVHVTPILFGAQQVTKRQDSGVASETVKRCTPVAFAHQPGDVLTMTCNTAHARIMWWVGDKIEQRVLYSEPLHLTEDMDITAMSFMAGWLPSSSTKIHADGAPRDVIKAPCSTPIIEKCMGDLTDGSVSVVSGEAADATVTLYWSIDGNDPKPIDSALYSGPVDVFAYFDDASRYLPRVVTFKAVAFKDGHERSAVAAQRIKIPVLVENDLTPDAAPTVDENGNPIHDAGQSKASSQVDDSVDNELAAITSRIKSRPGPLNIKLASDNHPSESDSDSDYEYVAPPVVKPRSININEVVRDELMNLEPTIPYVIGCPDIWVDLINGRIDILKPISFGKKQTKLVLGDKDADGSYGWGCNGFVLEQISKALVVMEKVCTSHLLPLAEFEIGGHCSGSNSFTAPDSSELLDLSFGRAVAVHEFLLENTTGIAGHPTGKINPTTLTSEGYGGTKPKYFAKNGDSTSLNQRVEFVLMNAEWIKSRTAWSRASKSPTKAARVRRKRLDSTASTGEGSTYGGGSEYGLRPSSPMKAPGGSLRRKRLDSTGSNESRYATFVCFSSQVCSSIQVS